MKNGICVFINHLDIFLKSFNLFWIYIMPCVGFVVFFFFFFTSVSYLWSSRWYWILYAD